MKAPNFTYLKPASLEQALQYLDEHEGAVALAGGQSLLPGLNMRVGSPKFLVDISDLEELRGIRVDRTSVRIGATSTHAEVLRSGVIAENLPLLPQALRMVAHAAVRNKGTFGGSLAYADPAAELPACSVVLNATIVVVGRRSRRELPANKFFKGLMQTALGAGELIAEIIVPFPARGEIAIIDELCRRQGDFALAGLAAAGSFVAGRLVDPRFAYFGCVQRTALADAVAKFVEAHQLPVKDLHGLEIAIQTDIDPTDTPGCAAETRRTLATVLTRRVLGRMLERRDAGDD